MVYSTLCPFQFCNHLDERERERERERELLGDTFLRVQKVGLQYAIVALSYNLSLRPLFCLFLSGRFRQVLLYRKVQRSVKTTTSTPILQTL